MCLRRLDSFGINCVYHTFNGLATVVKYFTDRAKMFHVHCTPKDQGVPGQPSYVVVADLLEHRFRYVPAQHGPKNVILKNKTPDLVIPQ